MNKSESYKQYWLAPENTEIISEIRKRILHNQSDKLKDFCKMTEEGKIDLRGFPLRLAQYQNLDNVIISDLDLSYSLIDRIVMTGSTINNCSFSYAEIFKWWDKGCIVTETRLDHLKLEDCYFGGNSSEFHNVDFSYTDLSCGSFRSPQFVNCDFSRAKLRNIDFGESTFTRCKFSGVIKGVWFNHYYRLKNNEIKYGVVPRNKMDKVDFSEAELSDVMFTGGIDLSSVILPEDGKNFLVRDLHKAIIDLDSLLRKENQFTNIDELKIFVDIMLQKTREQKMWIYSKKELLNEYGENDGNILISFLEAY